MSYCSCNYKARAGTTYGLEVKKHCDVLDCGFEYKNERRVDIQTGGGDGDMSDCSRDYK